MIFISSPLVQSGCGALPSWRLCCLHWLQGTELTVTKEAKYCHRGTCQNIVKRHWGEGDWRVAGILAEKLQFSQSWKARLSHWSEYTIRSTILRSRGRFLVTVGKKKVQWLWILLRTLARALGLNRERTGKGEEVCISKQSWSRCGLTEWSSQQRIWSALKCAISIIDDCVHLVDHLSCKVIYPGHSWNLRWLQA